MNFDLLTCGVCYEKFDHNDRVPRVLPMCGHTICSICLKNILTNMGAKCPFDQKSFSYLKFEGCPVNFLVKQMIEGKIKTVFCQAHKQETRFVCFTDKRNICDECVWRDGHQSHKIKTLNAIKDDTVGPRDELESLLEEVDKCCKGAKDALEEQRSIYLNTIRNRFEEIRSLLDKKEYALNAQVNKFIDTQVKRIETKIGTSSSLRESMSKRLVNLKDIFQHEELLTDETFLEEMQSYIIEYKHKIDFKTASEELNLLRKSHQEKSHLFNESILSQHKFWKDLEFPLHDVLEDFVKIFPCEQTEEFKFEPPHFDFSKSFSSLLLKDGGTSLEILSENLDILETSAEDLDNTASELSEQLVSRYSPILNCIQKRISQASTISLKMNPLTIHKENSSESTENSFFLSTIEMNVGSYSQTNDKIKAEEVTKMHISKLNRIDKVMLTLDKAWLQSNFMNQNFVKEILQTNCLTGLSINLQEMIISHERLSDIFSLMPDLRTFSMNFEGSNFDDIAIQFLNEITLQFAVSLTSFDASFFKTHITDIGFSSFRLNSKTISTFFLDIGYTKISNKTIEYLSKALEDSFETLESFTLSLGHNKITDEGLDKFFTSMPQVKSFSLGLFRTAITDATIERFVQNALPSMEQLENLTLWLQRTQVTDKCVKLLISNVKPLKKFSLNLSATKVTNESIEPLVKEFLPAMKGLRELSLKFDDTEVSQELRDAAKKLEEDIVKSTLCWK